MYQYFFGIDISKDSFTVALFNEKKSINFENTKLGFMEFCKTYEKQLDQSLIVLETTGGYEIQLITFLQSKNYSVHRANTRKVKSFIRSYGNLAKSDSIDAFWLANYTHERHPKLELYKESPHKKLLKLVQRRNDLKQMLVQEKNRLQAPDQKELKKSFEAIIKSLEMQIKLIDEKINEICNQTSYLNELKKVLKNITGIGDVIAVQLIALLPELGLIDRKKIASLAGLAPHPNESGKKIGYRNTRGGRSDVKPILFMAALTASRSKSRLGEFYTKLVAAGKKKMVALTALMRKILVIANAKIRDYYLLIPNSST